MLFQKYIDFENVNIQEPPEFGNAVKTEFLKGLAAVEDKMVILLEIDHLIDFNEINKAVDADITE